MARYNKIYAGPFTEVTPQVQELPAASGGVTPGTLVVMTAGTFALAGAATVGKVFVAQDNYLAQKGVDTLIAAGEVVIGMELLPEQLFNVRVPTSTNVARGAALTPAASGNVGLATDGDLVIGYADEAYNNTSGSTQLVRMRAATGYIIPVPAEE